MSQTNHHTAVVEGEGMVVLEAGPGVAGHVVEAVTAGGEAFEVVGQQRGEALLAHLVVVVGTGSTAAATLPDQSRHSMAGRA